MVKPSVKSRVTHPGDVPGTAVARVAAGGVDASTVGSSEIVVSGSEVNVLPSGVVTSADSSEDRLSEDSLDSEEESED